MKCKAELRGALCHIDQLIKFYENEEDSKNVELLMNQKATLLNEEKKLDEWYKKESLKVTIMNGRPIFNNPVVNAVYQYLYNHRNQEAYTTEVVSYISTLFPDLGNYAAKTTFAAKYYLKKDGYVLHDRIGHSVIWKINSLKGKSPSVLQKD